MVKIKKKKTAVRKKIVVKKNKVVAKKKKASIRSSIIANMSDEEFEAAKAEIAAI